MTQPRVVTFGCRLNAYESEAMKAQAEAAGLGDAIIVNTCAVTAEAERQARQQIRRLRRENPDARIVVTGCAAQVKPESWAAMPEVSHVIGNAEKMQADTWQALTGETERVRVADIMTVRETASHLVEGFEGKARAFLQVQNGCDHRCTFCIIPYGRGNSRSVPLGAVVEQARALTAAGYAEIVLTGVDLTSYGGDLPGQPTLGQAAQRLLNAVPELKRLRLSSLDPVEIDDDLFRLIAEDERVMPHLHLSVQAGDDMVLKRMKRRHLRADVLAIVQRLRAVRPGIAFGADLIAGFPTESEAMFHNTLDLVDECGLVWLHVFPYSARGGTPAAKMPQVPVPVRKERAALLRAAGAAQLARWLEGRVGQPARVLVEQGRRGRDDWFAPVELDAEAAAGSIVSATVTAAAPDHLRARLAA
jgi:threonylcarbamoyladenosine tRNA methylthiotransferase MtaB